MHTSHHPPVAPCCHLHGLYRSIMWVVGWLVVLGFLAKEFIVDVFMGALDDLYGSSAQWHGQNRGKMPPGKRAAMTLGHWVPELSRRVPCAS